jgi:hypothetical protein
LVEEYAKRLRKPISFRVDLGRVKVKDRVIRGYFVIYDETFSRIETEHELHGEEDFGIVGMSLPSYSFPRWDGERQKICETVSELENRFGNTVERQIIFTKVKSSLLHLREKVGLESRAFLRVLNMCYDALQNIKAERLKKSQVEALKFVIGHVDENIDDFLATELEGILINSGLEPTPTIEGIAELYR